MKRKQQGYFLILAVIFVMVIGVMGTIIAYTYSNRAMLSAAQQSGLQTFYIAESGLEMGTRLLTMPNLSGTPIRIACGSLTGFAPITNAALGSGRFTITTINSSPVSATDALSAAITSSSTTINATSTSGFAPSGKMMIDQEAMDYAAISGNSFIGVTRGTSGTTAASHASGAGIGQYLCSIDVNAAIPNLTSPSYFRELQWNVQLEEGWAVGVALNGSTWNIAHWNIPTELAWTQQNPSFASAKQLNAVSMLSNADVWAVGNSASALHYNGTTWSNVNSGIAGGDNLLAVSAISSQEAWASTGNGKVYKWSGGSTWSNVYSPGNSLDGISMVDTNGDGIADTGWAVGSKKNAYRYNGSTWVSTSTGITVDLNAVSTLSASDAWAVGNSGNVFKWNGTNWSSISSATTQTLNGISMISSGSSDIGWAVGASSAAIYYDGTSWSLKNTGIAGGLTLNHVVTVSANEAWLVASGGQIYEWNGSTWTLIFTSAKQLYGIDAVKLGQPVSGWDQVFR